MKMSYLKITKVEKADDKNGNPFKKVSFAPVEFMPNGKEVLATGKERVRVVWPDTVREVSGVPVMIKGDLLFDTASVDEYVAGTIESFNTQKPYEIDGKELNRVTVVSFKGESPAILAANLAGVAVIDGEEIVKPTRVKTAITAPLV